LYSREKHLPRTVEFGEEPTPVALRTHDQRRALQFIDRGSEVCDLTELKPMLAKRVFEFCQAEFHLENRGTERFTEFAGLFRLAPLGEI